MIEASMAVEQKRLASIPLAVIRRQARAAELSRVVPECCGLVWNAVRAQQVKAGRNVAIYWDSTIRLEVGVELARTRLRRSATSCAPQHRPAMSRWLPISDPTVASG